jgi:hypothetical protein
MFWKSRLKQVYPKKLNKKIKKWNDSAV